MACHAMSCLVMLSRTFSVVVQVTVRRTALLAVSRLLRELPYQTAVTELWVRAALPMVSACMCHHLHEQCAV